MKSYKLVKREIPKNTKYIKFHFKNDKTFGMLNLCCWKDEIDEIDNANRTIIDHKKINIYFPMFDYFYVKTYRSNVGFTFRKLVDTIIKAGLQTGKYDTRYNPQHYFRPATAEGFIGEFAITSSLDKSDIEIKGNSIYISLQH